MRSWRQRQLRLRLRLRLQLPLLQRPMVAMPMVIRHEIDTLASVTTLMMTMMRMRWRLNRFSVCPFVNIWVVRSLSSNSSIAFITPILHHPEQLLLLPTMSPSPVRPPAAPRMRHLPPCHPFSLNPYNSHHPVVVVHLTVHHLPPVLVPPIHVFSVHLHPVLPMYYHKHHCMRRHYNDVDKLTVCWR